MITFILTHPHTHQIKQPQNTHAKRNVGGEKEDLCARMFVCVCVICWFHGLVCHLPFRLLHHLCCTFRIECMPCLLTCIWWVWAMCIDTFAVYIEAFCAAACNSSIQEITVLSSSHTCFDECTIKHGTTSCGSHKLYFWCISRTTMTMTVRASNMM